MCFYILFTDLDTEHMHFFSFHPYCLQIHFSCVCDHTSYGQEQLNWCHWCFFNYCRFASAAMKFACNYMRRSSWLIHHIYIYMGLYCAHFNAALFNRLQNLLKFCNIRAYLDSKKFCAVPVTSNLAALAWSTKYRRKKTNCTVRWEIARRNFWT